MNAQYTRAPHVGRSSLPVAHDAPNAALLIDFDNVTMGIRSDLSKELKTLLASEVIKGKVTVQRAYADWRRYPQYIVPLSEASVDLIFAPAYGSSKKNATDIRMAIDGMELVFIRPEIGTFILLTGDSDFSSLVLKLKEYGKYVIGVGIQESSSDILVQNCDEYYSYSSLTGLRKTSADDRHPSDPWGLVEKAIQQMVRRNDVMRSDRLKQVMMELDPNFDEGSFGFSKFSKFLTEASSKGLVSLKKLDNGQYEISESGKDGGRRDASDSGRGRGTRDGRSRRSSGERERRGRGRERAQPEAEEAPEAAPVPEDQAGEDPLRKAYDLLRSAVGAAAGDGGMVRDSDVKRKMLAIDASFDEAELGFGKFSQFLRQAHEHEVIRLVRQENGNFHVGLGEESEPDARATAPSDAAASRGRRSRDRRTETADTPTPTESPKESRAEPSVSAGSTTASSGPSEAGGTAGRLMPRVSHRRPSGADKGPPPILEGQVIPSRRAAASGASASGQPGEEASARSPRERMASQRERERTAGDAEGLDPGDLGLPTDPDSVVRYLTNSYKGVGMKTAETLVDAFGERLFEVFRDEPDKVSETIPAGRAEMVLEGWRADFERRTGGEESTVERPRRPGGRRTRRSARSRGEPGSE